MQLFKEEVKIKKKKLKTENLKQCCKCNKESNNTILYTEKEIICMNCYCELIAKDRKIGGIEMLKYTKIGNFEPVGEIGGMFSHIYQFVENIKENPSIILINGFVEEQKVFKGKLYNNSKKFIIEKLKTDEIKQVEQIIGSFKEVDFKEFIKNTIFDNEDLNCYTEHSETGSRA